MTSCWIKKAVTQKDIFCGVVFLSLEWKPLSFKSSLNTLLIFLRFLMLFFLSWTSLVARSGRFTERSSAPSPTPTSATPWITWGSPTATRPCPWMPARSWIWGLAVPSQGDSSACRQSLQLWGRFRSGSVPSWFNPSPAPPSHSLGWGRVLGGKVGRSGKKVGKVMAWEKDSWTGKQKLHKQSKMRN